MIRDSMTKQSGLAVLNKYGVEYFKALRKKVRKSELQKSGRKGGIKVKELYGSNYFKVLGRKGGISFKQRLSSDKNLKEVYRKNFIDKMKKFTKIHETESGVRVRSKLEQKIANFLTKNKLEFAYESIKIHTKYGIFEPDFVIGNTIIEVLGMETDFYIKKKIRKLQEAINAEPNLNWIAFTNFKNIPILKNCIITKDKNSLIALIR